jgi:hypothetical protein
LDESNDVADAAHFLIFIRGIGNKFSFYEQLSFTSSLHGSTTGGLFMKVEEALNSLELKWGTLKTIMMDSLKNVWS